MRIVYVYYALAIFGGIERVLIDKMNGLVELGCDVYLLTANQGCHSLPFKLDERVHYNDMNVNTHFQYRYNGLRRFFERFMRNRLLFRRLSDNIHRIKPDIIVTTTNGYISELAKLKGNVPLIVESHTGYDYVMGDIEKSLLRRIEQKRLYNRLHRADIIVALTENDAQKWKQFYPCVKVVPNVVNLNVSGVYSSCDNKRVIFAGRNNKEKAIPDLLKIWLIVHSKHPDWQLDMYVERQDTQFIEETNSLGANIHVYPPVSDIMVRYVNSSISVLTSLYESFGLVIVEAMSCGLPVVSFESDGPCSIIIDGVDGFIVKNRSIESFANCVCNLIENPELRRQMGQNAILSSQRYSYEHIIPLWKELFETYNK